MEKLVTFIASNAIIYDEVRDNLQAIVKDSGCSLVLIREITQLEELSKIDLLFIEQTVNPDSLPLHKINQLVNISNSNISESEIRISRPVRMSFLLSLIHKSIKDKMLFLPLDHDFIYSERLSHIKSSTKIISLTNKENEVLKALIEANNHCLSKEQLKDRIWKYHHETKSGTIDTHIYKLKQKLPDGMFEIKNDICYLLISKFT